ncbi:MAG TPA: N-acetyl-gamma-glutamyl-phosphate reductase [Flavipsychrobacter sp.]|nr:N-acetyl-gamma-glutamyl-phosphate reductase [Flavipsychrobacter sp.]
MNNKIRAGIIGGAGYTGGELIRLLLHHPVAEIAFVHSRSHAGSYIASVHTDLTGDTDMQFVSESDAPVDVLFLCVGHGEAKEFLQSNKVGDDRVVIDLSQDFRLASHFTLGNRQFVYGLPEINKQDIIHAKSIANPGCFATAIQLALLPLAISGLLHEVHVTGITGATGAGQKLQASSHFAWRANNIQAYKALSHQHVQEILQTLQTKQAGFSKLNFIPWRGDFTRGIYISAYTACDKEIDDVYEIYESCYHQHPFTHVSRNMIDLKQVVNTNKCLIHLEQMDGKLIVHSAIDNLLKGASGQAVQNMNLVFGLPEDIGLKLKSLSF